MSVKEEVLACLEQEKGAFISGEALAQRLGVSRNAVWKAIKALEAQGYAIEGVTKKFFLLLFLGGSGEPRVYGVWGVTWQLPGPSRPSPPGWCQGGKRPGR